jgi:dTDP-4-dehydrorhamnose 3,5-epimerase-like enzyme
MKNPKLPKRPELVSIPTPHDRRGALSVVEGGETIPFEIRRVYYLYDVPGGAKRGGHAHRKLQQLLVALSGSFDVTLDDGQERTLWTLNRAHTGLYIPAMHWREISNFSSGAVCLVLASEHYEEADYIRSLEEFRREAARGAR